MTVASISSSTSLTHGLYLSCSEVDTHQCSQEISNPKDAGQQRWDGFPCKPPFGGRSSEVVIVCLASAAKGFKCSLGFRALGFGV